VTAEQGVVRRRDGTIAGSAATLLDGVRRVADSGAALGDILAAGKRASRAGYSGAKTSGASASEPVRTCRARDDLEVHEVLLEGRSVK